jgi:hypothetical protein
MDKIPKVLLHSRDVLLHSRAIIEYLRRSPGRHDIPDWPIIVERLMAIGGQFREAARWGAAEEALRNAIEIQERLRSMTDLALLSCLIPLAEIFMQQLLYERAEPLLLRVITIAGKTDARKDEQLHAIKALIVLYGRTGRKDKEAEMRRSFGKVSDENPFVINDRPCKKKE